MVMDPKIDSPPVGYYSPNYSSFIYPNENKQNKVENSKEEEDESPKVNNTKKLKIKNLNSKAKNHFNVLKSYFEDIINYSK